MFTRRQQVLLERCKARLKDAQRAATGVQFYLAEFEHVQMAGSLWSWLGLGEHEPPYRLNDEGEFDYDDSDEEDGDDKN